MRKPEPLSDPVVRAIARARDQGAHVARIRMSAQFLEGMVLEEDPRLSRTSAPEGAADYAFDGYPIVVSRVSGWVLETRLSR